MTRQSRATLNRVESFWDKVQRSDNCWEWRGGFDRYGYGQLSVDNLTCTAHRFSYVLHYGRIPVGLAVRHKCDNPKCVRPDHLELGTQAENVRDEIERGRFRKGYAFRSTDKLNIEKARQIRALCESGIPQKDVAVQFGIGSGHVSCIVANKIWKEKTA